MGLREAAALLAGWRHAEALVLAECSRAEEQLEEDWSEVSSHTAVRASCFLSADQASAPSSQQAAVECVAVVLSPVEGAVVGEAAADRL